MPEPEPGDLPEGERRQIWKDDEADSECEDEAVGEILAHCCVLGECSSMSCSERL